MMDLPLPWCTISLSMDETNSAQILNFARQSPIPPSTPIYHFMGLTERDFESDFTERASDLKGNESVEDICDLQGNELQGTELVEEIPKFQTDLVKKGRGRPKGSFKKKKKVGINFSPRIAGKTKKRGRPRKIKIEQIENNSELAAFDRDAVINEIMRCADILRSHGDKVVITVNSSNNTSIAYPDDLTSKVTEFLASTLGINL